GRGPVFDLDQELGAALRLGGDAEVRREVLAPEAQRKRVGAEGADLVAGATEDSFDEGFSDTALHLEQIHDPPQIGKSAETRTEMVTPNCTDRRDRAQKPNVGCESSKPGAQHPRPRGAARGPRGGWGPAGRGATTNKEDTMLTRREMLAGSTTFAG